MSLFGGDSPPAGSRSPTSDFSISPIPSPSPDPAIQANTDFAQSHNDEQQIHPESLPAEDLLAVEDDETAREVHVESGRERFPGSDSTWRHYTHNERILSGSLDQLRADDLSIHLYNAHAWKSHLRSNEAYASTGALRRKNRWVGLNQDGKRPWYPEHTWSHWPLEPEKVPRAGEVFGVPHEPKGSDGQAPAGNVLSSGDDLQEDLYALMMRRAAEQWRARPSETAVNRRRSRSRSVSRHKGRRSRSVGSDSGKTPVKRSPDPETSHSADESLKTEPEPPQFGPAPTLSADEDRLRLILQPSVNHLMSRIDGLLMALHHNRVGHSAIARDSDAEESRASSHARSRSRSARPSRSRTPYAEKTNEASDGENHVTARNSTQSVSRSRSRKRSKPSHTTPPAERPHHRSGSVSSMSSTGSGSDYAPSHRTPRDWSEVLGLAAMTSWSPAALQRTLQRCSKLFGEDMALHIFDEEMTATAKGALRVQISEAPAAVPDLSHPDDHVVAQPKLLPGYSCPYTDCIYHTEVYPFSQGYRYREHLRRKHKLSASEIKELETALHISGTIVPSTKNNPRAWVPPDHLVCPHGECRRSKEPFSEPRRLVDHVKRVHKYDPRKESPPPALHARAIRMASDSITEPLSSPDVTDIETDDDMVGGVHNDGFMRPISAHIGKRGKGKKVKGIDPKKEMASGEAS